MNKDLMEKNFEIFHKANVNAAAFAYYRSDRMT